MPLIPLVSLIAVLGAQAPDSIYSLAVDSLKYPQEPVAYLLDYGEVKREADGTGSTTFRTVIQILKQSAVPLYQEQSFSYSPGHERLTINWIRVVKPTGEVISEAPTHVQDADVPALRGNPVYADRKIKRVSLTGVASGTIVDVSYTKDELKPFLQSDFFTPWRITPFSPVMRSYFKMDVPASMKLHLQERNLNFKRAEQVTGGRRVITWATANLPPLKAESFAPDTLIAGMYLELSGPVEWKDVAKWYAENAKDRYVPTALVKSKVSEAVKGARTLNDSIAGVHKWVAQDIRYVAIALGLGGYQPRMPDSVITTGYGDCKDKATLFITAMKVLGIKAYPVILNSQRSIRESVPSVAQFDHVIVAIDRGPKRQYADMTAEFFRIGQLGLGYQGSFGLLVHEDGSSETIRFPAYVPAENLAIARLNGTLREDGSFEGWFEQTGTGFGETTLRSIATFLTDSARRDFFRMSTARRFARDGESDSVEYFQARDLSAKPIIRVHISKGRAADPSGSMMILPMPFAAPGIASMATQLEKEPKRTAPIDLRRFHPPAGSMQEYVVTLPAGWKAKLPANVSVQNDIGTYSANYSQTGTQLRIVRTFSGTVGVLPAERMADVIAWLRAVGKDDARFIVLERGT